MWLPSNLVSSVMSVSISFMLVCSAVGAATSVSNVRPKQGWICRCQGAQKSHHDSWTNTHQWRSRCFHGWSWHRWWWKTQLRRVCHHDAEILSNETRKITLLFSPILERMLLMRTNLLLNYSQPNDYWLYPFAFLIHFDWYLRSACSKYWIILIFVWKP